MLIDASQPSGCVATGARQLAGAITATHDCSATSTILDTFGVATDHSSQRPYFEAFHHAGIALVTGMAGKSDAAGAGAEHALAAAERCEAAIAALSCRVFPASLLLDEGDVARAIELILDDFQVVRRRPAWLHRTVLTAAVALAHLGEDHLAATLYGAIDRRNPQRRVTGAG